MNVKTQVFVVLGLAILSFLVLSFFQPPTSYQELRRAILVKENIRDFKFFQTYNGEPYFTKPPLYTWLASVWSKPFSSTPEMLVFALRAFSIFCYALLFFFIVKFYQKNWEAIFWAILALLANFRFFSFINRIDLEPLFVLFSFLMFYFSYLYLFVAPKRIYQHLFFVFLTAGFLTRGPLNLFYIPGLLVYGLLTKEKKVLRLFLDPLGWLISITLCLGWYAYGYLMFGKEFFQEFLGTDIKTRLVSQGKDPWYYYWKHFLLNFWFCFVFLFYLFWKNKVYLKERFFAVWDKLKKDKELLFLLTISLIPVFCLSLTGKKFNKYLLWVYPFWALFFSKIIFNNLGIFSILRKVFIVLVGLNVVVLGVITFKTSFELSYQLRIIKEEIIQGPLAFWQKENPIIIFYGPSPIKVLTKEEELLTLLNQGYNILSEEKLPQGRLKKNFVDPYQKTVWYIFSQN
ncbi:hypothetical protein F1847_01385 [Thermodesulfobacterium sp. TA1]|uniref:ArnT family glycosyltransferase n=1 Tax=Thermodesulfobacterium sp. TA1 TaxID=2234087 RepID=UPI001232882A|nr:glycosyltransferase family 39 protein [Thermodesulfobacterium sp. TA1]QER41457.1 hypothetical protein F1847_01385 [Thermodesulfobacterium sp. TA1]